MAHKANFWTRIKRVFFVINVAVIAAQATCPKGQFWSKFTVSCSDCPDKPKTSCKDQGDDAEACEKSCILGFLNATKASKRISETISTGFLNATKAPTRISETISTGFRNSTQVLTTTTIWTTTQTGTSFFNGADIFLRIVLPVLCFFALIGILVAIYKWLSKRQAPVETTLDVLTRPDSHVVNLSQNDAVVNLDQNDSMTNNSTGSATEHADQSDTTAGEIPFDLAKVPNPEGEEERRLLSDLRLT